MDSDIADVELQQLYQTGEAFGKEIQEHLDSWPLEKNGNPVRYDLPNTVVVRIEDLRDQAHRWFNQLTAKAGLLLC